jgi:hypothetical protein
LGNELLKSNNIAINGLFYRQYYILNSKQLQRGNIELNIKEEFQNKIISIAPAGLVDFFKIQTDGDEYYNY